MKSCWQKLEFHLWRISKLWYIFCLEIVSLGQGLQWEVLLIDCQQQFIKVVNKSLLNTACYIIILREQLKLNFQRCPMHKWWVLMCDTVFVLVNCNKDKSVDKCSNQAVTMSEILFRWRLICAFPSFAVIFGGRGWHRLLLMKYVLTHCIYMTMILTNTLC